MEERCPHLPPQMLDVALLLTSELVTNAVRHGAGEIRCSLSTGPTSVRLEVHDENPELPEPAHRGVVADSGRGLHILESLASRWGSTPDPTSTGKTVWFEIDAGLR
jgi:two-component sensor histidine kinase